MIDNKRMRMKMESKQLYKWVFAAVFTVCNVLDCYYTQELIKTSGIVIEANPFMAWVIDQGGFIAMWSIKMIVNLVFIALLDFVSLWLVVLVTVIYFINIARVIPVVGII